MVSWPRSKVLQDTLVPLMASRGVEMILGILGIMRTGSGFLDSIWPQTEKGSQPLRIGPKKSIFEHPWLLVQVVSISDVPHA